MGYLFTLVCWAIALIAFRRGKRLYNPVTIFSFLWGLIILLNEINLYNYNAEENNIVYQMILVGTIAFSIGGYVAVRVKFGLTNKSEVNVNHDKTTEKLNRQVFLLFAIISIIVQLYDLLHILPLYLMGMSMHAVRSVYEVQGGVILSLLRLFIVNPFIYIVMPVGAIEAFSRKNDDHRKSFLTLSIVCVLIQIINTGGRVQLVQLVICIVLVYFLYGKKSFSEISRKTKTRIFFYFVIAYGFLVLLSMYREIDNILESFYAYIAGCVPYLGTKTQKLLSSNTNTYGLASMFGFYSVINTLFSLMGNKLPFYETVRELVSVQDYVLISERQGFNAFVTPFYYFFCDGHWIGIVVLSFLYGYFSVRMYQRVKNNPHSKKAIYIYTLVVLGLVFSMVRIQFSKTDYCLALLYAPLFFMRRNKYE